MKRYKLIGDEMFERNNGEWVRWDDVKPLVEPLIEPPIPEVKKNATDSDNKRNSK